jgi:hypothetical protein
MVEVATGAGSGETLPLLLKIPRLRLGNVCFASGYSTIFDIQSISIQNLLFFIAIL